MGVDIFQAIVLIIPGYLSLIIYEMILGVRDKQANEFDRLATSLGYSIPVFGLTWFLILLLARFDPLIPRTLPTLLIALNNMSIMLAYSLSASVSAFIVAYLAAQSKKGKGFLGWAINASRKTLGLGNYTGDASCWDACFNANQLLKITKPDGQSVTGFMSLHTSSGDIEQEMILEDLDVIKEYEDAIKQCKPIKVYYNANTGCIVEILDRAPYDHAYWMKNYPDYAKQYTTSIVS